MDDLYAEIEKRRKILDDEDAIDRDLIQKARIRIANRAITRAGLPRKPIQRAKKAAPDPDDEGLLALDNQGKHTMTGVGHPTVTYDPDYVPPQDKD